ncbi:PIN domain-containing protein [uncultured Arthrobacter sp.]|uniref:PIN domain-containing protein n=1 Tax=uncultured Arthrobacter sp. TaxID=114050 RepID=UPI00262D16DA|nr:type II toxin-antitoxin system VapC family toxin [uncultured Arthrobacter sp.]
MDTNVLVRYLIKDHPEQSTAASALFGSFSPKSPGYLSATVLVETFWVLKRVYKVSYAEIADVLLNLASSEEVVVEHSDVVRQAARKAAEGYDFADALIALNGRERGCDYTATFDTQAATLKGMKLLK